jgi:hypothetical protein
MLDLNREADERNWHDPWKVLIYDVYCREIISPLLKIGDLRKRGITLHLLLESDREPIADVPAIYFIQPTRANIKRLSEDCARGLYETYYVNFTPAIPRHLLEEFATAALESQTANQACKMPAHIFKSDCGVATQRNEDHGGTETTTVRPHCQHLHPPPGLPFPTGPAGEQGDGPVPELRLPRGGLLHAPTAPGAPRPVAAGRCPLLSLVVRVCPVLCAAERSVVNGCQDRRNNG